MITPINNNLKNKKHLIFYKKNDFFKLKQKILFYLENKDLARKIAKTGTDFALKYHKPSDRIDEILSYL